MLGLARRRNASENAALMSSPTCATRRADLIVARRVGGRVGCDDFDRSRDQEAVRRLHHGRLALLQAEQHLLHLARHGRIGLLARHQR